MDYKQLKLQFELIRMGVNGANTCVVDLKGTGERSYLEMLQGDLEEMAAMIERRIAEIKN